MVEEVVHEVGVEVLEAHLEADEVCSEHVDDHTERLTVAGGFGDRGGRGGGFGDRGGRGGRGAPRGGRGAPRGGRGGPARGGARGGQKVIIVRVVELARKQGRETNIL